jgi:CHAT domain-containing protein/Tfp pilus assembly protein PilF
MRTDRTWAAALVVAAGLAGTATPQSTRPAEPALTPEQRAKLTERDRWAKEAIDLERAGKLAEAAAAAGKVLVIEREVCGPTHPNVAVALLYIGRLQMRREDWAAARAAYRELVTVNTAVYGPGNWQVTDARLELADVDLFERMTPADRLAARRADELTAQGVRLERDGKYADARTYYEQALDIRKRVLGEAHPVYAMTLGDLARGYHITGEYTKAEPLYRQAVEVTRKARIADHPSSARVLANLGQLYRDTGEYAKAEPLLKQVVEIKQKTRGPAHPEYAASLHKLAGLYHDTGEYAKAEPLYRQFVELERKAHGPDHPEYAVALNNLAELYRDTGRYSEAEPLYQQSVAIKRKALGEDHPGYAASLDNLAQLYVNTGRDAEAESLFKRVVEIRGKTRNADHLSYAKSLINLALLYNKTFRNTEAEALLREALELTRKARGADIREHAIVLNNLATVCWATGRYTEAEPLLKQALEVIRKVRGETHPEYAVALNNLGGLYRDSGRHAESGRLAEQALRINLAALDRTADVQPEQAQIAFAGSVHHALSHYLAITPTADRSPAEAYAYALRWKGQVFVRQRRQRDLARAAADPETAALASDLLAATRRLAAVAGKMPRPNEAEAWEKEVAALAKRRADLEYDLTRKSAAFRQHRERETLSPDQIRKLLPAGAALVDYYVYRHYIPPAPNHKSRGTWEERLVAFVVRPDREIVRVELGPFNPIREAIESWLRDTKRRRPLRGDDDPAAVLRDKLWLPVARHLDGATTVLVSPDADLARLPFGALPGSKDGAYLVEELAVAVLPVPQLLPDLVAPRPAGEPSLLAVGDVDYGADPGKPDAAAAARAATRGGERKGWGPLPATREEVDAVRAAFGAAFPNAPATVLRGAEPTEDAIRRQLGNHRWVHLATHGFFAPPVEKPGGTGTPAADPELGRAVGHYPGLLSGVALAGANRPLDPLSGADDGVLTAAEVATLDLTGVEVVVLSACETGLGKEAPAEGVLGLQRAFQVAGVRTVVVSLWAVPDDATRQLITRAYQGWWGGKTTKLETLVAAQRWVIANGPAVAGKGGKTPPYYWAAFVLAGDWR